MKALFDRHLCFFLDCTLPFLLQHHGYLTVVSNSLHEGAHQVGQRAGEPYIQISLVRRRVPRPVLLDYASVCIRPVAGRLAGPGRRRRAHRCVDYLRDHRQRDAVTLPPLPAQVSPQLGLFAPAPALHGSLGQHGDRGVPQTLLRLLLQMLQVQRCRRGRKGDEEEESGDVR